MGLLVLKVYCHMYTLLKCHFVFGKYYGKEVDK